MERCALGFSKLNEQAQMKTRRRFKHTTSFQQRLVEEAQRFREEADRLPPGTARELLLRRVRQAQTAAQIDKWLSSPDLHPPKELEIVGRKP